jgi:hypothetical protein
MESAIDVDDLASRERKQPLGDVVRLAPAANIK